MFLLNNNWGISSSRTSQFAAGAASVTACQLLNAALNDLNFAEILLNHKSDIAEQVENLKLEFHPKYAVGFDFDALWADNEHSVFYALAKATKADLDDCFSCAFEDSPWMSIELAQELTTVVLNIAHLENMVALLNSHKGEELATLNSLSINNLAQDYRIVATLAALNVVNEYKPDALDFQKNVIESVQNSSSQMARGEISAVRLQIFTALQGILNRIAVDFSHVSNETKMVDLEWADERKYNQANKHLNKNYTVGGIFLPKQLFENLPFSNAATGGIHRIVPYYNRSEEVEIGQLPAVLSYTLDTACDCDHDCCSCSIEDFYVQELNKSYMLIKRNLSQNI